MTKTELKEKYTEWNKSITKLTERKNEIFHELEDLCEEKAYVHHWCSINFLVKKLIANGKANITMQLVSEYYEIRGKQEALREFAVATKNFDI